MNMRRASIRRRLPCDLTQDKTQIWKASHFPTGPLIGSDLKTLTSKNRNSDSDSLSDSSTVFYPNAYDSEELIILYPIPFGTIFHLHNTPVWVNDIAQIVGRLDGTDVAVDVLGEPPENPGLGVVHYATGVEDVIRWIETPATAPAVLITTHLFGPDVMIRCSSSPLNSTITSTNVLLMGQFKSFTDGNKESLDAGTTSHALTSLDRDHWFKQTVCQLASSLSSLIKNLVAATPSTSKT